MSKREAAQVGAHWDECADCRGLAAELADVNGALRAFVAPLVLGLGAGGYLAATVAVGAGGVMGSAPRRRERVARPGQARGGVTTTR
ncbi:hypothetical protein [Saccharothrix espanaensis]|uniref:hypothetical protein n=1 Tax=Saccharothrix espanaensis TaxID=103731 RepID=UPI0038B67C88